MNNKLTVLFLIEKGKTNKQGKCPLKCRLTYKGERKPFSTGLFINPNSWNNKIQEAIPPDEENNFINTQLSLIKNKISQAFLFLQVNSPSFTIIDLYNQYKGVPLPKELELIGTYDDYLVRIYKLVDRDIKLVTYNKYKESKKHLEDYIQWKFKTNDVKLNSLKSNFINDYEYFLRTEKSFNLSTINKAIQRFRKVVKYGVGQNYLDKDPFTLYRPVRPKKEVIYLSKEELFRIEGYDFAQSRLEQVRDMFVFCCYTGLAFNEMSKLEQKHVGIGFDGYKWVKMTREKTSKEISIPLLPKALDILEKLQFNTRILPTISNQKFNSYLKEIALVVGIEKNLTHHIARKTFATTILLYNDVPMEIVSELLGHSKMSITQEYYGKVVQNKVSEHMVSLSKKLKNGGF